MAGAMLVIFALGVLAAMTVAELTRAIDDAERTSGR